MSVSATVAEKYRERRAKGDPARSALEVARAVERATKKIKLSYGGRGNHLATATLKHRGFDVYVFVEYDEDMTTDDVGLGRFTAQRVDDTSIALFPEDSHRRHRSYRWWTPEVSIKEHRESLNKMGYSRGVADELARSYVYEDLKRATDEHWTAYSVGVRVSKAGVELATNYLGGITVDDGPDDPYLADCAEDILGEAISEAKKEQQRICKALCSVKSKGKRRKRGKR